MGLFGTKWVVVKVVEERVILTDNRSIAVVNIRDNKMEYDKKQYRLPKYILDKVQSIIDARKRDLAMRF
jgi:hypothetical protein